MPRTPAPRRVSIVVFPGVQSLDLTGPLEVFHGASRLIAATRPGEPRYEIQILSRDGAPLDTSSGLRIIPHAALPDDVSGLDTLIVAGGTGTKDAARDAALIAWLARAAAAARRTASVCTGAFLLARAGLLDGRRATTHWSAAQRLAALHPAVHVDAEPIYLRDEGIWTSAGVTAGMDLALAIVEEDLGPNVALAVARLLVVFFKRPGGQAQFSSALQAQQAARPELRELQAWIAGHLDQDLSVAALAERATMSERSFARAFSREVGQTPAAYVEALRIEHARDLLEDGAPSLEGVAQSAGFASAEVLRRAFHRRVGVSPADYRERFRRAA
jgi:transcriptional regulator GlxA family with amidase domain